MLLNHYGIRVSSLWLLQIHEDLDNYSFIRLPIFLDKAKQCLDIVARDLEGGASGFTNVCLINSLRRLGVPLEADRHGPFWALRDGNEFLLPHGLQLVHIASRPLPAGRYVMWTPGGSSALGAGVAGHFVSVICGTTLLAIDDDCVPEDLSCRIVSVRFRVFDCI